MSAPPEDSGAGDARSADPAAPRPEKGSAPSSGESRGRGPAHIHATFTPNGDSIKVEFACAGGAGPGGARAPKRDFDRAWDLASARLMRLRLFVEGHVNALTRAYPVSFVVASETPLTSGDRERNTIAAQITHTYGKLVLARAELDESFSEWLSRQTSSGMTWRTTDHRMIHLSHNACARDLTKVLNECLALWVLYDLYSMQIGENPREPIAPA